MEQFGTIRCAQTSNSKMSSRIKSRAWFFTWNNPPVNFVEQLNDTFDQCGVIQYVYQLEMGEKETRHVQGVCRYDNPRATWPGVNCHWERCRNWRKAVHYCSKIETRIDGPWTNIEGLKFRRTIRDPLANRTLYEWQKHVIEIFEEEPDDRKVYWIWDNKGCSGKTTLAKHLCLKYSGEVLYLNGCNKDIMCAVAKTLEQRDLKGAIFGLSRQDRNGCSYKSLEILKDGIGFSGKYESMCFVMNPIHVIVFANFEPDTRMLSDDRWEIFEIIGGRLV